MVKRNDSLMRCDGRIQRMLRKVNQDQKPTFAGLNAGTLTQYRIFYMET